MLEDMRNIVIFIIFIILVSILFFLIGYSEGERKGKEIINQLCNQKEYDFCVLKEKTYVLKENKI